MHAIFRRSSWAWAQKPLLASALLAASVVSCMPDIAVEPLWKARPAPRIARPTPVVAEGAPRTLLELYAARPPIGVAETKTWQLPFQAKRVVVALLISTALDRIEDLELVLTPTATWGLPDRRRVGARPVFDGDQGEAFLTAFRKVATRFPEQATWTSKPVLPGLQETYRSGAEPMWSYWSHGDEHIVTSMIVIGGYARIDYIGFWEDGPIKDIDTSAWGPPPPFIPLAMPNRMAGAQP